MLKFPKKNKKAWEDAILARDLQEAQRVYADGVDLEWRLSFSFPAHGSLTALMSACMMDWDQGALWLIEQGACVDSLSSLKGTSLSFAVKGECLEVVEALLARNPETINLLNDWDETPLHVAVSVDSLELAVVLLNAGADPLIPNQQGKTPIDMAEENASPELSHLFHAFQAALDGVDLDQSTAGSTAPAIPRRM